MLRSKTRSLFCLLLIGVTLLCSCGTPRLTQRDYFAMDTVITLSLPEDTDSAVFDGCEKMIVSYENMWSLTLPDSEISRFNRCDNTAELSGVTVDVLKRAYAVSAAGNGAFSLTIAPVSTLWKPFLRGEVQTPPTDEEIEQALAQVDDSLLSFQDQTVVKAAPNVAVDLGACAKGYACEQAVKTLAQQTPYGMVSFGGNIGVFGTKPDGSDWTIGIKDPAAPDQLCGSVTLQSGFVSVSGAYERYRAYDGITYHHIIDPQTGYPADSGLASVAVISEDGLVADALSTALFVMGYEESMALYRTEQISFEAVFCTSDGKILITPGLEGKFQKFKKK